MPVAAETGFVTRFVTRGASKVDVADDIRLKGYPIVFNVLSQDLGGFRERIAPSAVERTLRAGANVDALLDHRRETTTILGSTESGLMRMKKDRYGLAVDIDPPDTTFARDLLKTVKAGLVKGMSFAFRVYRDPATGAPIGETWDEEDGEIVRTVTDMEFSEVSLVVNPAYLQTEVSARNLVQDRRSLEDFKASLAWRPSRAFRERQLRLGAR